MRKCEYNMTTQFSFSLAYSKYKIFYGLFSLRILFKLCVTKLTFRMASSTVGPHVVSFLQLSDFKSILCCWNWLVSRAWSPLAINSTASYIKAAFVCDIARKSITQHVPLLPKQMGKEFAAQQQSDRILLWFYSFSRKLRIPQIQINTTLKWMRSCYSQ